MKITFIDTSSTHYLGYIHSHNITLTLSQLINIVKSISFNVTHHLVADQFNSYIQLFNFHFLGYKHIVAYMQLQNLLYEDIIFRMIYPTYRKFNIEKQLLNLSYVQRTFRLDLWHYSSPILVNLPSLGIIIPLHQSH